jgi:ubiquinone/menaquinone biosynthesis C-methylase UbiE
MLLPSLPRTPEPEQMTEEEEDFYAQADYSGPHEQFAEEIAASLAAPGLSLLDLGCGPGDILIRLRQKDDTWHLFGLDRSLRMLSYAIASEKARCGPDRRPINWTAGDAKRTGFANDCFDVVICNSALHHWEDARAFWREVKRIVKPHGLVFLRDLRRPGDLDAARSLVQRHVGRESAVVQKHYLSSLQSAYTTTEVERQLAEVGFAGLHVIELADRYLDVQGQALKQ